MPSRIDEAGHTKAFDDGDGGGGGGGGGVVVVMVVVVVVGVHGAEQGRATIHNSIIMCLYRT